MIYYSYMHTGIILLAWIIAAVVLFLGMVASGFVTIKIEKVDPDDENQDDEVEGS